MTFLRRVLTLALALVVSGALAPHLAAAAGKDAAPPQDEAGDGDANLDADEGEPPPPFLDDADAKRARREADRARAQSAAKLPPPTEAELGVPLYPGARFEPQATAAFTSEERSVWLYLSDDSPEKVAAFYEKKLGKAPVVVDVFREFVLRGKSPYPDHGVLVEPNRKMYPPPAKTVISVQKVKTDK